MEVNSSEFLPDDLSDKEIAKLPKDEQVYENAFKAYTGSTAQALKANDFATKDTTPDRQADVLRLANDLKVNPGFVERNYDILKSKATKPDDYYEALAENNPAISKWLEDHSNMAIAKDDIESLSKIENATKEHGFGAGLWDAVKSGVYSSAANLAKAPALFYEDSPGPSWLYEGSYGQILKEENSLNNGKVPEVLYKNAVTQYLDKKAKENAPELMSAGIIEETKKGNYANASKAMAYQIASNMPNLAMLMFAGPAGLGVMGVQSSAGKMAENLDKGIPADLARSNALVTGTIEAGIESIGGVGSAGFKQSLKTIVDSVGKSGAKELMVQSLKKIAKSAGQEGGEEIITSISQDLVDYGSGVNDKALDGIMTRALNAGLVGAGSGMTIASSGIAANKAANIFQKTSEAASNVDAYVAIGEAAKDAKLNKRMPEKLKEVVENVTEGTKLKDVYIPVEAMETYFQSKNIPVAEAAQNLGIYQEYNQAKESGSDVKIPLSTMVEKLVNTEHYQGLASDIKFDPDQLTKNELKVERDRIKNELGQVSQEAIDKGYSFEAAAKEVGSKIEAALKEAEMSPKEAKANAKLAQTVFANMGERMNIDPNDLLSKYGFSINGKVIVEKSTDSAAVSTVPYSSIDESGNLVMDQANLDFLAARIENSQAGQRIVNDKGETISIPSTFPDFMKDKGYAKKETLNIIEKYKAGKKLTEKQAGIIKELYDSVVDKINNRELFQAPQLSQDQRGKIQFGKNTINIELLKGADQSTFIHETGHFYVEMLKDLASSENAPEDIKNDWAKMKEWLGVTGDEISVEQHEQAARGFEAYIMEGKAPTKELQKLFNTFKTWLLNIYRSLKNLNVELSDEVRGVYDRLLVADMALDDAYNEMDYDRPLLADYNALGMSDAAAARYIGATEEARLESDQILSDKVIADFKKTQSKEYKEKRKQLLEAATEQVNSMPLYKAYDHLKYNKATDGTPLGDLNEVKFNKAILVEMFGKDVVQEKLKGMYTTEGGLHPDEVATIYGANSGSELVNALMEAGPKKDFINQIVDRQMTELYPEISNTLNEKWDAINEAIKAAHNDKRAEKLRIELDYLAKNEMPTLKDAIRTVARRVPTSKQVKELAMKQIAGTNIKDIRPSVYRSAEKKYAKLAGELLAKGDFEGAFEAKRKEYLNFELYRSSEEANSIVEKNIEFFKKLFKSDEDVAKNRDVDLVNAARSLVSMYGLGKANKTYQEYLAKMQTYDPDAYTNAVNLISSSAEGASFYKNVTLDKFTEMSDTVSALWDLAKSQRQNEVDGQKIDRELIKSDLIGQLSKVIEPEGQKVYKETIDKWGKVREKFNGALASLKRIEHWADAVDVTFNGPFRRFIWQPVSDAVTNYRLEKGKVLEKYTALLKDYQSNLTPQEIAAPEIGFKFKNKAELIMAMLNTGNESNKQKLLVGRGWAEFNEAKQLDTSKWDAFVSRAWNPTVGILNEQDFKFMQNVWDLMDYLKPGAQKAHKQMYGYYFNEITANEFETPFGKFRGGYIPAKVDVYEVEDGAIRAERNEFENNNNSFQFPTTGKGFTKSRVEQYMKPLSLDMNLLGSHIDSVLRFTYIEPRVKEVARVVSDESFRKELSKLDTNIGKDALIPWLQRTAQQKVILPSDDGLGRLTDAAARFFSKNIKSQIMFGNVTNTLQQITGLVVAMSKVAPKHIRNGFLGYVTNNKEMTASIMEKSDWMRSTQGSNIFELHQAVNEIIVNPSTFDNIRNFTQKHTYFLQSAAQNMVNTAVWQGAYEQSIANNMTEKEAIRFADSAVRETQGTNNPEDVSRYETGTPTAMLFKSFVSYFNMLSNLNAGELIKIQRSVGLKKGMGKAFYLYMTAFMLPAVLSEGIVMAMSGKGFDQDDDESYVDDALKAFFGSQFKTITATIPYGGQFLTAVYNRAATKELYDDRLSLSPVISTIEGVSGLPVDLYKIAMGEAEVKKKTVKDALQFVSVFSGVPTGPIAKSAGYLMDVESGKAKPTGPIDYTRGLITGKSGN